ncbi:hypothetical protein NOVOSPHI9U_260259 [Novosphingobium sp. 9U]|nr:hypothetical protein NOVOSPHI9U_260259 [Novosphingobium sp. 9U]
MSRQLCSRTLFLRVHGHELFEIGLVPGVLFGVGRAIRALLGRVSSARAIRRHAGRYGLTAAAGCLPMISAVPGRCRQQT